MENVYKENGYAGRKEYLNSLADEYDVPIDRVEMLASMLGMEEDFDMLVSCLDDLGGLV